MEATKSPVPNKKTDGKTMTFNQAINEAINNKKIHKLEWEDVRYYAYLKDEQLVLHKPDGKDYQWILSLADLTGDDYITL